MICLFNIFILLAFNGAFIWGQSDIDDATISIDSLEVTEMTDTNTCAHDPNWENIFFNKKALAVHCGPVLATVGLTAG